MVSRRDYEDLAPIPGGVPKPKGKRDPEKARTTANSTLRSYATLNPVNKERRAEAHEEAFGLQADACREIGICCCCGMTGQTEPHHLRSRGAGGDDSWCIPLLARCHTTAHALGATTFWTRVGIDPLEIVEGMRAWVAAGCPFQGVPWQTNARAAREKTGGPATTRGRETRPDPIPNESELGASSP